MVETAAPSDYRKKVLSSLAWQGSAQLLGQLISWASTILVIRLLDPSDYGLMAMASLFMSFLLMLSDLGIGAAIVQADELDEDDLRTIQGIVLAFNVGGLALTLGGSWLVAAFFDEPMLVPMLNTLSVSFLCIAIYTLPQARLMRDLRFDRKARVDLVTLVISALTSLVLAWLGFGVWALVGGTLAKHLSRAVCFNWVVRELLVPMWSMERGARFMRFGSVVVLDRLLWFMYSNMDVMIAGKLLGADILGFYSVALSLAAIPLQKVMPVVTQVAFPAVARIQKEPERVRSYMLRALKYGNLIYLPVFWGMAWVGRDAIPVLLGEEWQAAVVPFCLISIILPLKAQSSLFPPALFGLGQPMVNVVNMAISLVLMSVGFAVGARWGLVGLAGAWVVAYPVAFVIATTRSMPAIGLRWVDLLKSWRSALGAIAAMSAAVVATQLGLASMSPTVRLVGAISVGALVYPLVLRALDRKLLSELRGLFRRQ